MSDVRKLFIPKDVGELMFGNISSEEKDPHWHLFDPTGDGEHTFCSMAWDEIEELSAQFGVKTKSKRGGFCDCPYCINTIIELKSKLDKIKIKRGKMNKNKICGGCRYFDEEISHCERFECDTREHYTACVAFNPIEDKEVKDE